MWSGTHMLDYSATKAKATPPPRVGIRIGITLGVLYLPYAWLLFVHDSWDYKVYWFKLWPALPELLAAISGRRMGWEIPLMWLATAGLLTAALAAGWRSRTAFIVVTVVLLAGSIANSWFAYLLFKA